MSFMNWRLKVLVHRLWRKHVCVHVHHYLGRYLRTMLHHYGKRLTKVLHFPEVELTQFFG
jgi:hypothetical protein